jgi:hypothetical protein
MAIVGGPATPKAQTKKEKKNLLANALWVAGYLFF